MLNLFKSEDPTPSGGDDLLFFNPDPFVNRMNLIIRLVNEMDITSSDVTRDTLSECIKLTLKTLIDTHEGVPHGTITH